MIPASATTIQTNIRIRRERRLAQAGEITVVVGQQVTPVQVVARTSKQRGYTILPAAELLGVRPEEVSDYLLVEEGAAIQRKKPLLEKRSLFGSKTITSPVNGVLYQVNDGRLILQQTPDLLELRAMLPGMVTAFVGNHGVAIETKGALLEAKWASGREGYGTLKVLDQRDTILTVEHIGVGADVRGMILIAGHINFMGPLELAEENSARGVIAGSVRANLVPELQRLRFPVMITEGFGAMPMSTPAFELLQACNGRDATLLGATDDDWLKPEIIVPLPEVDASRPGLSFPDQLELGQLVRVSRAPHAGRVGVIRTLVKRAQPTKPGYRLPGAEVALEDGQTIFVPYANLDMIR